LLISRKLQVPVIVGEERHDAGTLPRLFGPQLHLLDDGFNISLREISISC
jgi:hypothetical protein